MELKNQDLFNRLNMNEKDNPSAIVSRINYFFENYSFFVNCLLFNLSNFDLKNSVLNITRPAHYATLISSLDLLKYKNFFLEHNFKVSKIFKSFVIETYLKKKYQENSISVHIEKLKDPFNKEVEIFVIETGLTIKEIRNENILLRHFAIEINQPDFKNIEKLLISNKFKYLIGGSNNLEKSTTACYDKVFNINNRILMELFIKN